MFRGHFSATPVVRVATRYGLRGRALAALTLCVSCLLILFAEASYAGPPKLISYGGLLVENALGVAIDQSSGDVYVAALDAADINKFDALGELITPPSPFGGGFFSGTAVNPTDGDVYVLTAYPTAVIDTYDPSTGDLLSSFEVPSSKNLNGVFTDVQIATDAKGNVYVPIVPENKVLEYGPTGTLLNTFTGGSSPLKGPTGVAVDASGDLWIADNGDNRIEELSAADSPIGEIKKHGRRVARARWPRRCVRSREERCGFLRLGGVGVSHLVEYSSAGAQLADVGAGSFETDPPGCPRWWRRTKRVVACM